MQIVRDQSDYIVAAVNAVKEHLILGSLFAALIVWFFLSSPKLPEAVIMVAATMAVYFLMFRLHDFAARVPNLHVSILAFLVLFAVGVGRAPAMERCTEDRRVGCRARHRRVRSVRGDRDQSRPPGGRARRPGHADLLLPQLAADDHLGGGHPELDHRHVRGDALRELHAQRHHAAGADAGGRYRHRRRGRRAREHLPLHGREEDGRRARPRSRGRRKSAWPFWPRRSRSSPSSCRSRSWAASSAAS